MQESVEAQTIFCRSECEEVFYPRELIKELLKDKRRSLGIKTIIILIYAIVGHDGLNFSFHLNDIEIRCVCLYLCVIAKGHGGPVQWPCTEDCNLVAFPMSKRFYSETFKHLSFLKRMFRSCFLSHKSVTAQTGCFGGSGAL